MPGCAAIGCNNRSEKGYRMKSFPRDPKLRKIWQERVGRANWEPSNNSFLCHAHFESDKWCIMENGRVKLQKDAVPSIFTVTSTRKSIKKRVETPDDNIKTMVIRTYSAKKRADDKNEKPDSVSDLVSNLADNSNEDLVKSELKEELKEEEISIELCKPELKEELKEEQTSVQSYNYDELEEKLKQICDGYFEENNSNDIEKPHSISDNQKEVSQQASNKTPVHRSINYKHSSGNDIGHMLTNDTENIEIIFSAENGEDDTRKCTSRNSDMADETEMLDSHIADISSVNNDKEIEQNINVAPNIVAAMKRKRKTRNEIMKSIEKSIRDASSLDTNSLSDSDTFDDPVEVKDQRKKIQKLQNESSSDASPATTRFTVKVTGHPDDVSDIMQNLSKSARDTSLQEYNDVRSPEENDGFVTSVITIDDCPVDVDDKAEFQDDDSFSPYTRADNDRILPSTSKNSRYLSSKVMPHFDEELNDLGISNNRLMSIDKNEILSPTNDCDLKYEYEKLQRKLSMQANVVKELSSQLISCKRAEHGLQNKNLTLEKKIQRMTDELNARSNDSSAPTRTKDGKMNVDMKQDVIDDLTNKLNHFEEANKKLVRSTALASEQVKKLENQIKQKDNQIKEFTWKLDKASKYLERAEKNTNTYRRKMMNLQGLLKRKKLLDEKVVKFNEILVDVIKKGYTNKILPMSIAMKIKKTCGTTEYDKLLQSGFPLPSLSAVRIASDNLSDSNESTNENLPATTSSRSMNEARDVQLMKNHVKVDSENVESVDEKVTLEDTETIMGTVQDIFDETSDDDLSTNELTEYFISYIHKFM